MKKILFVCSGNVGRSQMAEAYYNHFTNTKNGSSAGVDPTTPKKYLKIPDEICKIMSEEHIDISNYKVKLVNKSLVNNADEIFVMCEKVLCPDFLVNSGKVTFWTVKDPYKMSLDDMRNIKDQIKKKVISII